MNRTVSLIPGGVKVTTEPWAAYAVEIIAGGIPDAIEVLNGILPPSCAHVTVEEVEWLMA